MHTVVCIHLYPTYLPGGTEKNRWEYIGGRALVSGCPEHWTINHQIRAKVHRPSIITMHARPRQTDGRTNILTIARRFLLTLKWSVSYCRQFKSDSHKLLMQSSRRLPCLSIKRLLVARLAVSHFTHSVHACLGTHVLCTLYLTTGQETPY